MVSIIPKSGARLTLCLEKRGVLTKGALFQVLKIVPVFNRTDTTQGAADTFRNDTTIKLLAKDLLFNFVK